MKLILKDGTIIDGGEAGLSDNLLWLWFPGMTMPQVSALVFDPAVIGRVIFQFNETEVVYTGYISCKTIMQDGGRIAVCMAKG